MSINFQELVLNGYFVPFNQTHLSNYFYREFKKAEKKYYDADEFFDCCLMAITELIDLYNKKIRSEISDLETIFKGDDESALEIEEMRKGNFALELISFGDRSIPHRINLHQITGIKKAINEAYQKSRPLTAAEISIKEQYKSEPESIHKNGTNLFCNTMPLYIPKEHFKVFTETRNKTGQPFLTEVQLNTFIERAFCGNKELPIQKFNHAPKGEKFQIQKVFYDFYCKAVDYFPSSRCRDHFIRLLTDNFIGWDFKNVKSNFAKQTR
jgi:hypothetical protein